MFSWVAKIATACWKPVRSYARMNEDNDDDLEDSFLWGRDLERHSCGELSFAVVQANDPIEDHSQVEIGNGSVFVGVYDGHGGPEASRFVSDNLFKNFIRFARESGRISEDVIRSALSRTEEGFITLVRRSMGIKPTIAAVGSCCLVGVICNGTLYVANLGDSRAVMGCLDGSNKITAEQLTMDHNASMEEVRQELRSLHPDDSQIVVLREGVWRIKGIIQVSRSIGDAYLKQPEFSMDPSFPRFHVPERIRRPVLTAEPSLYTRVLQPRDRFIIFASDGLWEHLTNKQAVEIVSRNPRMGIARRLIKKALTEAAEKRKMTYKDLINKGGRGMRRQWHDDITVVVVFIDHQELVGQASFEPDLSVYGFADTDGLSRFSSLGDNASSSTIS